MFWFSLGPTGRTERRLWYKGWGIWSLVLVVWLHFFNIFITWALDTWYCHLKINPGPWQGYLFIPTLMDRVLSTELDAIDKTSNRCRHKTTLSELMFQLAMVGSGTFVGNIRIGISPLRMKKDSKATNLAEEIGKGLPTPKWKHFQVVK